MAGLIVAASFLLSAAPADAQVIGMRTRSCPAGQGVVIDTTVTSGTVKLWGNANPYLATRSYIDEYWPGTYHYYTGAQTFTMGWDGGGYASLAWYHCSRVF